ncbi:MAG TPA: hypothetical protein VJ861_08305 [Treponemataceae bacterium]|nr:hypothetical protein [Treponemataceae bacterium]
MKHTQIKQKTTALVRIFFSFNWILWSILGLVAGIHALFAKTES